MSTDEEVIINNLSTMNEVLTTHSEALKRIIELLEEINYKLDRK